MTAKDNQGFAPKDAVLTVLIYALGIQLLIPVVLTSVFAFSNTTLLQTNMAAWEAKFLPTIQVLTFFLGTLWLALKYRHQLKMSMKRFMENFSDNMILIVKYYFIAQLLSVLIGIFFSAVLKIEQSSENQQAVESLIGQIPLMMAITTIIFAPIIEELVFRGGLFLGIRNLVGELPATLISSISFGAIHVIPQLSTKNPKELFFIVPYALLGYFMVRSVQKTDSLMGGIVFHFLNNLVATLLIIFMPL